MKSKLENLEDRKSHYNEIAQQVEQSKDGQVSTTDPDARSVILKRNIVLTGYNIQATADSKHNMIIDVFADGVNDLHSFSKAGKRAQEILDQSKIDLLADKGYHNGIEIGRAERIGVRPFIAVKENASNKEEGFNKKDFIYDSKLDQYTCPVGQIMTTNNSIYKKNDRGEYRFKRYTTSACLECPMKSKCTQRHYGRMIERATHQVYVERNRNRVERYKDVYRLRQQIIEPIFGILKRQIADAS